MVTCLNVVMRLDAQRLTWYTLTSPQEQVQFVDVVNKNFIAFGAYNLIMLDCWNPTQAG
jgi:hypothetical protein